MAFLPNTANLSTDQILNQVYDNTDNTLRVDATVTAVIGDVVINSSTSSVTIGNPNNGNTLNVQADGSINVNTTIQAISDNILVVGTADGTLTGTQNVLEVDNNKNLHVINMGVLIPTIFDYIDITNSTIDGQEVPTTIIYKSGGAGGTQVAELTLTYDGNANLLTVTRT